MVYKSTDPSTERMRRKRAARRAELLEAAMDLVSEVGLEQLKLADVADRADLTTGALYRYFGSKDALVAAMEARALGIIGDRFDTARARARIVARQADLTERPAALHALLDAAAFYLALPRTLPQPFRLVTTLLGDPRPLIDDTDAAAVIPAFARLIADVDHLFEDAARTGALDEGDARQRTLAYWSALHGTTQLEKLRRFQPDAPTPTRLGLDTATALLRGWGAPASSLNIAESLLYLAEEAPE